MTDHLSKLESDNNISSFDEAMFEHAVIQRLQSLGYEWLYGPDINRTNELYRDALLPGVLEDCLHRINPKAHPTCLTFFERVGCGGASSGMSANGIGPVWLVLWKTGSAWRRSGRSP